MQAIEAMVPVTVCPSLRTASKDQSASEAAPIILFLEKKNSQNNAAQNEIYCHTEDCARQRTSIDECTNCYSATPFPINATCTRADEHIPIHVCGEQTATDETRRSRLVTGTSTADKRDLRIVVVGVCHCLDRVNDRKAG